MSVTLRPNQSLLLWGDTGDGKTAQVGEAAELHYTPGRPMLLYSSDRGGVATIQNHIDLGYIQCFQYTDYPKLSPWLWLYYTVRGMVPATSDGTRWEPYPEEKVSIYAFEGITSCAEELNADLSRKAALGKNLGGSAGMILKEGPMSAASNNQGHYSFVQGRVRDEIWQSQFLPHPVIWTAAARRTLDADVPTQTILGPQMVGKAMTSDIPRWFTYCFRVMQIPASGGKESRYILYLGDHVDQGSGNAKGLGNARLPIDAAHTEMSVEPASVRVALQVIDEARHKARATLKARMEAAIASQTPTTEGA